MSDFIHQRHKPPARLERPRELVVACPPLRSNVNLSRIARTASCCGVGRMIVGGGNARIDPKIARDAVDQLKVEVRRSLAPALKVLKSDGYRIVGLEQTTNSASLHGYQFERRSVLVVGHERKGLDDEILQQLDVAIEIPVYGLPHSYNVATAASMALYEYCRQFPSG